MISKISEIEPFYPSFKSDELEKKAIELLRTSSELGGSLADVTAKQIAELVRLMNSYYSNLIEGNRTTPREIEKAMNKDLSADPRKREKELEHVAHIKVQNKIDIFLEDNSDENICSLNFICWIHKEFYMHLPEEYRKITRPDGSFTVVEPGEFRKENIIVGKHVPPAYEYVTEFLERFFDAYSLSKTAPLEKIIAAAASHHRLAWIHPFLDGNGRVTRLFTYAYMAKAGINTKGLWSAARGFARNLNDYYAYLAGADRTRINDYDGRGNLTDRGLAEFCNYFFDNSIDQVKFMSALFDIGNIKNRIKKYIELTEGLNGEASEILIKVFAEGEVKRADAVKITGMPPRSARRVLKSLIDRKLLTSNTPRGPLKMNFPIDAVEYYFPRLFPPDIE